MSNSLSPSRNLPFPEWVNDKLPKRIKFIRYCIELGNGDWALAVSDDKTALYSRYPFWGKQRYIKQRGNFQDWNSKQWARFLARVRKLEQFYPGLVGELNRLRVKL